MRRSGAARGVKSSVRRAVLMEALESRQLLSIVPTGYSESAVASGLNNPVAMEIAPDGRVFITEQAGTLRVVKNGALLANPALTLTVDTNGERGLLSVAFDPDFATNSYIYVYYTATTPTIHNRVSRFTMTGDTVNAASETIILDLETQNDTYHMGGDLHFGNDGKLYISTGDNLNAANAQTLSNLKGKLLRINADGTIPTDNPFFNTATGKNKAIYALGLRNPFTFDVQSTTGKMFVNDVGQFSWEEINQVSAGANFGWPGAEGNGSDPAYTNPLFTYSHEGPSDTSGYAVTGGAFYNPTQAEFPSAMIGKYFFADYVNGWIRVLDPATGIASPFATSAIAPVDLEVSSDGSLYYLSRSISGGPGALFRIRHIAAPQIVTQPQSQAVPPGSPVTFSVTATGTGPLTYQWQRNGVDINGATASSYTINAVTAGDTNAKFRVIISDSSGNAVLTNGATWTAGQNGSAVNLDGVNDYVETNTDLNQWLGNTSTLTAWIKTTQAGTNVFYEAPGITGVEQSGGDNDIMWGWINANGQIGIHPGNNLGLSSSVSINNGVWHHVALTRNASTGVMQVYVDGVLSGTANSAAGVYTTPYSRLGSIDDTGGTPSYLGGALDDVRIYNRVLTAAEVANAANLPTSGLVSQYLFNENAGTIAQNNVPQNNSITSAEATLIVASGSLPTPTITTPIVGTTYTAGDTISFSGTGTDPDDGTLAASAFTWRIDLHHDVHSHPAMPNLVGVKSGSWVIPVVGETSDNVWYRVFLTVTDSSGQSVTTFRDVLPNKANITLASNVPSVTLTLDGVPTAAGSVITGVAGIQRALGAPATVIVGGITYNFTGWSDGGAAVHNIFTPLVNTTYTAVYAAAGAVYASDIAWASATNSYGAVELDKSMGEGGATDGNPITLNGVVYAKGLGVHALSEITYNVAGKGYKTFISDVGVDDEVGANGSLTFQVLVDGVLKTTATVTGASATQTLSVDLTGATLVKLVVTDSGDNDYYDHGDWAGARFVLDTGTTNAAPTGTIVTPAVGSKYTAGTVLNFSGTGSDTEDGTLPASAFTWKIDLVHDDHTHTAMAPITGVKSGTFTLPNTGETSADVLYRVTLTVTDSGGKTTTIVRDVLPNTVTVTLASNIAGVPLLLDGVAAPSSFVGVAGVLRTIGAPATFSTGGQTYTFSGWSDSGAASHQITTPNADTTYTATYTLVTNAAPTPSITTPVLNAKYIAGQAIAFGGDATDAEDGTLAASKFAWKIDFYKDNVLVSTAYTLTNAKSGSFTPPTTGETSASVFYRVSLTVTDSAGSAVTVTRDVLPTTVTLTFASNPTGAAITLDGVAVSGPITSVVGVQRALVTPASFVSGGTTYNFTSWSDAGAATHTIATPAANTTYIATYTAAPVSGSPVYVSDLTVVGTPINGWGLHEKDKSNGETGANDGKTITLQGVTYTKGLGVHANSDLTFNLGGQYATFLSDIGIDDEVGSNGNVTFVVYLDGVQVYTSGAMTGSTATKSINLNVTGKNTLRLVVNQGVNDNSDHADWANARLLPATAALPAGWTSGTIGTVTVPGSAGFVGGNYVVSASGAGITGTSDSFRFTHQQLSNNMQITARVTSLTAGAMAGVMLRSTLAANSANAGVYMNASGGFSWSRRTSNGGSTTNTNSSTSAQPYWIRISRVGNVITSHRSINGTTWIQVGSQTISLGTSIYVGLAVTSKVNATAATAVFDNVSIVPL